MIKEPHRQITLQPQPRLRTAFTLIELLIVCTIIAVLLAILLPALTIAREQAHQANCQSNLRQLMMSFVLFAQDHEDQLPGGYWDLRFQYDPNPEHWDWLRGNVAQWASAPQGGTTFRYLNHNFNVYRCPSLDDEGPAPTSIFGPGAGSNGRFDYVSMLQFTGARMSNVHGTSQLTYPNGQSAYVATPVILEGDPILLNGYELNDWHAGPDAMSHTHNHGSFYASIDSSVHWLDEPPGGCLNWTSQSASGTWSSLAPYPCFWGQWNRQ